MKHLFNDLSSEERHRILEMHKTTSSNNFLNEDSEPKDSKEINREARLFGGGNEKNPPFEVNDLIKQIWRYDENGDVIRDGRGKYRFLGMSGNMMLIRPTNYYATTNIDTNRHHPKITDKKGNKAVGGTTSILHYRFADRFEKVG
jgi:hypothetical protein